MSREVSYADALREALFEEMRSDNTIVTYGEDFTLGYVWPVSRGLLDEFGPNRVRDVPICEALQVGMAVGAALAGVKPVVEMQFSDFGLIAADGIVNQAAKLCYMTGGQARLNLVVRMPYGTFDGFAAQHSQTLYSLFGSVPGLYITCPATPRDAKGLLKTAIHAGGPVLNFEHKRLYGTKGELQDADEEIPFGQATTYGTGTDCTVVAVGYHLSEALAAKNELAADGVDITVIDPRTLVPLDTATIAESVSRSGRLVVVEESPSQMSAASWITSQMVTMCFDFLEAPPTCLTCASTPVPYAIHLEHQMVPGCSDITSAVRSVMDY